MSCHLFVSSLQSSVVLFYYNFTKFPFVFSGIPAPGMTLRADIHVMGDSIAENIDCIDVSIITELEKDLEQQEIISLVFLLYDEPHIALERVKLFQTTTHNATKSHMNLLLDWAVKVQSSKPMWRYEMLEAMCICQLFSNIRKLGFDVSEVKRHFLPGNILVSLYIHPMKKVLYSICEGLTIDKLDKLKCALGTFNVGYVEGDVAEIIFLELICKKFISVGYWEKDPKVSNNNHSHCDVINLANILNGLGCKEFSGDLRDTQNRLNNQLTSADLSVLKASSSRTLYESEEAAIEDELDLTNLNELLTKLLDEQENKSPKKMKTDAKKSSEDAYEIIDPSNVGICYIINQVKFYPSQESIKQYIENLDNRLGSDKDRELLKSTFTKFGFTVVIHDNLKHYEIKEKLHHIITDKVAVDHSAFVLCILSHGMKGTIFGVDSVPVQVKEIQDMLCGDNAPNLLGKPKIILIQACQGTEGARAIPKLVTDGPKRIPRLIPIPIKADLVTYWATVPGHSSYRHEVEGSIFIQVLCKHLQKLAVKDHHLLDIFIKVNNFIMGHCKGATQVPNLEHLTLRKHIYLPHKS